MDAIHPAGPFPAIRPIDCAPWCTDGSGHTTAATRADQTCWGESQYVELSLEDVEFHSTDHVRSFWPSIIGPNAYRGFNEMPCVSLHFMLHERSGLLDDSCKLTASEARQLAGALTAVADEIEGAK